MKPVEPGSTYEFTPRRNHPPIRLVRAIHPSDPTDTCADCGATSTSGVSLIWHSLGCPSAWNNPTEIQK